MMPERSPPSAPRQNRRITKGVPHAAIELSFLKPGRRPGPRPGSTPGQRRGHANHAPAVNELLLDLVAPASLMRTVGSPGCSEHAGWRRRNLGQGFELGRLLCGERQRESNSAGARIRRRHQTEIHFQASLSEPLRIRVLEIEQDSRSAARGLEAAVFVMLEDRLDTPSGWSMTGRAPCPPG